MKIVRLIEDAVRQFFTECGYLTAEQRIFYPEVRAICAGNTCRNYAVTWACPPAVGTLEECREQVSRYEHMLLFSRRYDLEDSFDFEGMMEAMQDFKRQVDALHRSVDALLPEFLLLSNEGCGRCAVCTYPDAPCRFPQMLHPSLEGYGFMVSELAASTGMCYHHGANTVTYFGALLFQDRSKAKA